MIGLRCVDQDATDIHRPWVALARSTADNVVVAFCLFNPLHLLCAGESTAWKHCYRLYCMLFLDAKRALGPDA